MTQTDGRTTRAATVAHATRTAAPRNRGARLLARPRPDDGYEDDRGATWHTEEILGKGGQGRVYRTVERDHVLKILTQPDRGQAAVRRLPLEDLDILRPVALLRDGRGYVMALASSMAPVARALTPSSLQPHHDVDWYRRTGGLRRRLGVAQRVAGTIAALHARGLTYGDLNTGNVMVSEQDHRSERAVLVDADNITAVGTRTRVKGTPRFIPPEVNASSWDQVATYERDRWALAVLVFWLVTGVHPFESSRVRSMSPHERVLEPPQASDYVVGESGRGHPPGLSPRTALTDRLRELADTSLLDGLADPDRRASARQWQVALRHAHRHVGGCPCGWNQYADGSQCGSCGSAPSPTVAYRLLRHQNSAVPLADGLASRLNTHIDAAELVTVEMTPAQVRLRVQDGPDGRIQVRLTGCSFESGKTQWQGPVPTETALELRGPWSGSRVLQLGRGPL